MPGFGQAVPSSNVAIKPLKPEEISNLVELLKALQGDRADRAAAARGREIFQGRGVCFDCHETDARGDPAIGAPNLADRTWLYGNGSRQQLFESIAYGHQGMCPAWIRRLSPLEIRKVSLYVYSLSHSPQPSKVN